MVRELFKLPPRFSFILEMLCSVYVIKCWLMKLSSCDCLIVENIYLAILKLLEHATVLYRGLSGVLFKWESFIQMRAANLPQPPSFLRCHAVCLLYSNKCCLKERLTKLSLCDCLIVENIYLTISYWSMQPLCGIIVVGMVRVTNTINRRRQRQFWSEWRAASKTIPMAQNNIPTLLYSPWEKY